MSLRGASGHLSIKVTLVPFFFGPNVRPYLFLCSVTSRGAAVGGAVIEWDGTGEVRLTGPRVTG